MTTQTHLSVFDSVRIMMEKGMDLNQAIREVEATFKLRTQGMKLPDHIVALIRQECG